MTQTAKEKEIQEGKFFAVISYISFFCIVSLLLKKDNKFALHHAKQGLVLFVLEVASFILSIIPFPGRLVWGLGALIFTVLSLWGILQAAGGNEQPIPVISDIARKIVL